MCSMDSLLAGLYPRLKTPAVDLRGKHAIVTGANSGIGFSMAQKLHTMGAHVTLACRNLQKAEEASKRISPDSDRLRCMQLDCSSIQSIKAFVAAWGDQPISILMNNAGCSPGTFQLSEDGFENSYMADVHSHVLLTLWLLPNFAPGARIVETSSILSFKPRRSSHLDTADIDFAKALQRRGLKLGDSLPPTLTTSVYGRSKLLQITFVQALQEYLDNSPQLASKQIKAVAFHPGFVNSSIWSNTDNSSVKGSTRKLLLWIIAAMSISPEQGSVTGVWLATAPTGGISGGGYHMRQKPYAPPRWASDEKVQRDFWGAWCKAAELPDALQPISKSASALR